MAETKQKVVTTTLRHLSDELASTHELPKKHMQAVLDGFVAKMIQHMKDGARVKIPGLGVFQVRKSAARQGRNPATGEVIQIKAKKRAKFRAAKELKQAVA
jgi:DNA-binding protein HU-beta